MDGLQSALVHRMAIKAGIQFYWRIEQALTGIPIVYTYVLDMAATKYRETEVFAGVVTTAAPFPFTIDLAKI